MGSDTSVVLVSMPWNAARSPSIQLGILKSVLDRAGIDCSTKSYFLEFTNYLTRFSSDYQLDVEEYSQIADRYYSLGLGEWIFAVPPFRPFDALADLDYARFLWRSKLPESIGKKAHRIRQAVPGFLQYCLEDILQARPKVVGFATMFSQNAGSLALAKLLKVHDPGIKIVFGGANCQAEMGEALFRAYPHIDAVLRGEAEYVFPDLVQQYLDGASLTQVPGLCYRERGEEIVVEEAGGAVVRMDDVPTPNYDEYFERLETHALRSDIDDRVVIPYESARGCWWGAKQHCTFCGLNGATMAFRSKSSDVAYDEILDLSERYRRFKLFAVDNILDSRYIRDLLPKISEAPIDLHLFFEVKANLKREQLEVMRAAGVRDIQPGIESLSNTILKLMRKGTTGLQNIRLLKWCAQLGIDVWWNIIYGFPGEDPDDYAWMARTLPSLFHLQPPHLIRLCVDRFSPYHNEPREHGLEITGPVEWYGHIFDLPPEDLFDLAYQFNARYADGRDPESYVQSCRTEIDRWSSAWPESRGSLSYRRGGNFLTITDRRPDAKTFRRNLDRVEAEVYLACDEGTSPTAIQDRLKARLDLDVAPTQITEMLDGWAGDGLVYHESGRYLSLALLEN